VTSSSSSEGEGETPSQPGPGSENLLGKSNLEVKGSTRRVKRKAVCMQQGAMPKPVKHHLPCTEGGSELSVPRKRRAVTLSPVHGPVAAHSDAVVPEPLDGTSVPVPKCVSGHYLDAAEERYALQQPVGIFVDTLGLCEPTAKKSCAASGASAAAKRSVLEILSGAVPPACRMLSPTMQSEEPLAASKEDMSPALNPVPTDPEQAPATGGEQPPLHVAGHRARRARQARNGGRNEYLTRLCAQDFQASNIALRRTEILQDLLEIKAEQ